MSLTDDATITTVAETVRAGKCMLFLGAAVHAPPPDGLELRYRYPESERPPIGSALSRILAAKSPTSSWLTDDSATNLQRTSLYFEITHSRKELVEEVRAAVQTGRKPSPVLRALARLGFPLIITTNYDRLLERALMEVGADPVVSVYKPNEGTPEPTDDYVGGDPSSDRPFLFKIHGDIENPSSIVITDEDYIQFVLRMGDPQPYYPIPETFLYHFRRWPTLFIGYSLIDYNLRLLFKTLRWRLDKAQIPRTFSVDRSPDPLILDVWQNQRKYVNFVVKDVWAFVPELYQRVTGEEMPP